MWSPPFDDRGQASDVFLPRRTTRIHGKLPLHVSACCTPFVRSGELLVAHSLPRMSRKDTRIRDVSTHPPQRKQGQWIALRQASKRTI